MGGDDGSAGFIGLKSGQKLKGKGAQEVEAGERLILMTPGGAGRGDPRSRAQEDVTRDVRDGLISIDAARSIYGAR